ncbi:MarC family protein [Poseidonocella sp. HB161398]|uniref:MarC family protein n=1 Tax=Poseidonocella sp. HB161398 TaxID=2320855 RepID=UPI0011089546|nr:MarC family protein [Poseidonocella sp. HB161398]
MELATFVTAFTTLFVMIDPIGLAPIFVALTQGMDKRHRLQVAARACGIGLLVLVLFALFGMSILGAVGITLPAFRIAGGILLFLIAMEMLFEKRTKRREDKEEEAPDDPSVFPLATPFIAGPGALAATVLLTTGETTGWAVTVTVLAALALVVAIVFALFSIAGLIERLLGRTGIMVVSRLLGMLLAALAVQFVLDGLARTGLALP